MNLQRKLNSSLSEQKKIVVDNERATPDMQIVSNDANIT